MDCQTTDRDELIEKYLSHRLDPDLQDELELHIFSCSECARKLEVLQTIHAELTDRAHEIRTQTPIRLALVRWQTALAASVLVVAAVASGLWIRSARRLTAQPTGATASAQAPPSAVQTKAEKFEASAPIPAKPESPPHRATAQPSSTEKKATADASAALSLQQPVHPPQEQIAFSQPPATNAPSPNAQGRSAEVASNGTVRQGEIGFRAKLTTPQGIEWYRLGAVEAPPYTFAGLAAAGNPPGAGRDSSYSSHGTPADAGRISFQGAMRAYVDGRYSEAADGLIAAIELEPTAPDTNFYLGVCDLLTGRPEEAVAPLQAAAATNSPFLQSSHYYLAKAYIQSGKLGKAEAELNQAIALPGRLSKDAKATLARLQVFRKQLENQ